jgi:hypothetical protein
VGSVRHLIDDGVFSRSGDDELDLLVHVALLQVLGPPPVQLRIDLRVDDRLLGSV